MLLGVLKDLLKETLSTRNGARGRASTDDHAKGPARALSDEEAERRRTLEVMPNFAEAHNNLGVTFKDTNRAAEAEAAFRHAITLHHKNVVAHYNLGIILAETDRPWEAEAAYRAALNLLPNFVEAHNNLGVVLMSTGRLAEAEAAFRRALELKPEFVDAQRNLSLVIAKAGHLAEVEQNCRRALELTPNSADAHNALGVALKNTNHLAEAEAAFRRALELQQDSVVALYNLGVILAGTDRLWEAERAYRSALKLRPDFVEAVSNLGFILAQTNRRWEAEASFRTALELQPNHVEAYNALGAVLISMRRPAEAEAPLRQALALKPYHEGAKQHLDFVLKELKRLSETEAACQRAIDEKPNCALSNYKLGVTQMALGKFDEAVVSLKRVLAIEPNHARAHNKLGMAFMRQEQIEQAVACYHEAISTRGDFAQAMANLGAAYFLKKEVERAVKWNEAALAIEPHQMDANINMAQILLAGERTDEAKQYLDQASTGQSVDIHYATNPKRTVLLLWTTKRGNIPTIEFLFPATINTRVSWVIESARDDQTDDLPDYDVVFNSMGDADLVGASVGPVSRFVKACTRPVLNHPDVVARTARHKLPALLDGIDNIVVPAVWRFGSNDDWDESILNQLPLLVRPVESHGGEGLELVRTATELARWRASQGGRVYVTRFVDFRSADSWFRKYRIIFIDRKPYPYHLAISQNWIVHYFSADMQSCPWKLEEEKAFLQDPEAVLGHSCMRAIESIGAAVDLEYSGIDFSITGDKRILVFEANPTMLVHPENISGPLEYKNDYVFRIQGAFEEVLKRFCG